jgi:two-component system NtrC family sensor kinase
MTVAILLLALLTGALLGALVDRFWCRAPGPLERGNQRISPGGQHGPGPVPLATEMAQFAAMLSRMADGAGRAGLETATAARGSEMAADTSDEMRREWRQVIRTGQMVSLGELAGAVAHELNNPLSAVVMYARFVERELEDSGLPPEKWEELRRCLNQVQKDARRCGDVVRNLLLFSHPSRGEHSVEHLNGIIERGLSLVRHHLEKGRIDLDAELLVGDDSIECDPSLLQQAFVALLLDAAEAMAGGGRLTVRAAPTGSAVRIEISRTGAGSATATVSPAVETDGRARLGLLVACAIVQQHAGTIDIDSGAGGQMKARVLLPRTTPRRARATI